MDNQFLVAVLLVVMSFRSVNTTYNLQECGTALTGNRIVGGYDLGYYKYPWFAALQLDGKSWCGGTLIAPGVVVSAAHCFEDFIKSKEPLENVYKVKLGFYNDCSENEVYQTIYNVKKVYYHEKYWKYREKPYYDVAILILDGDTSSYQPVCLPNKALDSSTRGKEGYIQGLGDMKYESGNYPCEIREARVLIYRHKDCLKMLRRSGDDDRLKHAFCAGYLEGGIDTCQGDSGGPLVTMDNTNKYTLIGITSTGYKCAAKGHLGIYTDVSHYLDWIERRTGLTFQGNTTTTPEVTTSNNTVLLPGSFLNITEITITIELKNKRNKKKWIIIDNN